MIYSGVPLPGTPVPAAVLKAAAGSEIYPVWVNELGGLTYRLGDGRKRRFVKWMPAGHDAELQAEAERLRWASRYVTVPPVLDEGFDDTGSWLVTSGIPGEFAVADRWKEDPATAVTAIGAGLRALHDALPVPDCPFTWSRTDRLAELRTPAAAGRLDPSTWHEDFQALGSVDRALAVLADPPPDDLLVVCHGDACAPNTLIGTDGHWTGHVDLGRLGVADRWADLAIATWSTTWNYGPGWEKPLLEAYGIEEDPERTYYYRLLWTVSP
jgi:aminoglycoside phosphotransferase